MLYRLAQATLPATVALALLLAGCGHKKRARNVSPPPPASRRSSLPPAPPPVVGSTENGVASWYGKPYDGRRAADGEIYDMETLVAAHRTLPFNTRVRVYDLDNGKTIDVRIIDRGPFIDGRIIDLSHAAAREIEMIGPGVAKVRIEVIRPPANVTPALFAVQVGAFRSKENAEDLRKRMAERYGDARLLERSENPGVWRVLVGAEPTEDAAGQLAARIRQDSIEKSTGFIVRIDSM
jgi:rare lipoprotein A